MIKRNHKRDIVIKRICNQCKQNIEMVNLGTVFFGCFNCGYWEQISEDDKNFIYNSGYEGAPATPIWIDSEFRKHRIKRNEESKMDKKEVLFKSDVIDLLHKYGTLKYKEKYSRKPTHGTCCTCQKCGGDRDDCFCMSNEILDEIENNAILINDGDMKTEDKNKVIPCINRLFDFKFEINRELNSKMFELDSKLRQLCSSLDLYYCKTCKTHGPHDCKLSRGQV